MSIQACLEELNKLEEHSIEVRNSHQQALDRLVLTLILTLTFDL